jgi:hypothetical protein
VSRRALGLATALGALLVQAGPVGAQRIAGEVLDFVTSKPIVGATIQLLEPDANLTVKRTTRSDSTGKFVLATPLAGVYQIRFIRFGYLPHTSSAILVPRTGQVSLTLSVTPEPVMIEAVQSRATAAMSADYFETRRISGLGRIVTREQLDTLRYADIVGVIRDTPGAKVEWNTSDRQWSVALRQQVATGKTCSPAYFLNGARLTGLGGEHSDAAADLLFSTPIQAVYAVEIYGAISSIPGVYQGSEMSCGVIALWTRRPG